jgi:hypothetical protein
MTVIAPEKYNRPDRTYTVAEMEAALCAFEWMMDERNRFDTTNADDRKPHTVTVNRLFDSVGWSAMRFIAMQAGAIADNVYQHMEATGWEHHSAFDWEFLPAVMRRLDWDALVQDNQYAGPIYWPDPQPLLAALIEESPEDFHNNKPDPRADWIKQAYAEAERQWGYRELVDDHPERIEALFTAGHNTVEAIRWLGEHYDLTPRATFERGY